MAKITDMTIRKLSSKDKAYDEPLGNNLYITVRPNGRKIFTLRYTVGGRRTKIKLGEYPFFTLAQAMLEAQTQKHQVQAVGNLHKAKQKEIHELKQLEKVHTESNFFKLIDDFAQEKVDFKHWTEENRKRQNLRISKHILPFFDATTSINDIHFEKIEDCVKKNIALEKYETAEKVCCIFKGVYDYAYERNLLSEENLSIILRLQKLSRKIPNSREKTLYQVMTDAEIGELMLKLANYDQSYLQVQIAIKLAPYLALRSGELCSLEWDDVDLERKEIVIPAHKMKMKHEHLVPLSSQAVALLEQLPRVDSFLFCSIKKPNKPISTNALIMALRKMGYKSNSHSKDVFCTHGFRGMFSTLLHQHKHFKDFSSDVIEFQLAHTEKNKVKNSYNRTHLRSYFEERQQMMQMYANFLDELREKADKH